MKRFLTVLMVLMMACAMFAFPGVAEEGAFVWLGGVKLYAGEYLASGADHASTAKPAGGYAYLYFNNGVLTLELNGYDNNGAVAHPTGYNDTAALIVDQSLTLLLVGDSRLSSDGYDGIGFYNHSATQASLTVTGSGKLTVRAKFGIYDYTSSSSLILNSGTLEISSEAYPIKFSNVDINGGVLNAESPKELAILTSHSFDISGGQVIARSGKKYDDFMDLWIGNSAIVSASINITGGELDLYYTSGDAIHGPSLQCTLPLPEGAAIRRINTADPWFYLFFEDHFGEQNFIPGDYHMHLSEAGVPATGTVIPATGDSSPVMLWTILAAVSVLALAIMHRKQAVG